jgi:hypothetical protein
MSMTKDMGVGVGFDRCCPLGRVASRRSVASRRRIGQAAIDHGRGIGDCASKTSRPAERQALGFSPRLDGVLDGSEGGIASDDDAEDVSADRLVIAQLHGQVGRGDICQHLHLLESSASALLM